MRLGDVQKKRFPHYPVSEHMFGRTLYVGFRGLVISELIDEAQTIQHLNHFRIVFPFFWAVEDAVR
jgi:hypothetical protein